MESPEIERGDSEIGCEIDTNTGSVVDIDGRARIIDELFPYKRGTYRGQSVWVSVLRLVGTKSQGLADEMRTHPFITDGNKMVRVDGLDVGADSGSPLGDGSAVARRRCRGAAATASGFICEFPGHDTRLVYISPNKASNVLLEPTGSHGGH